MHPAAPLHNTLAPLHTGLPSKVKTHYVEFWSILRFLYHSIRLEKAHLMVVKSNYIFGKIFSYFKNTFFEIIMFPEKLTITKAKSIMLRKVAKSIMFLNMMGFAIAFRNTGGRNC